jgi:hypothetical protein
MDRAHKYIYPHAKFDIEKNCARKNKKEKLTLK